jgi:cytoskeletal protein CcmA (bactofilin family)
MKLATIRESMTRLGLRVAMLALAASAAWAEAPPAPPEPPPPPSPPEVSVQGFTVRAGDTHKGNIVRIAPSVSIEGTLDGDMYVTAQTVRITGVVTGDVFAAGSDVLVTGEIEKSLRTAAANLVVDGKVEGNALLSGGSVTFGSNAQVEGNVTAYSGQFTHHGVIGESLTFTGGTAVLGGKVKGDASITADAISVEPGAHIDGDLTYSTRKPMDAELRAITGGDVTYDEAPIKAKSRRHKEENDLTPTKFGVGKWIAFFTASFLFGCAMLAVFREYEGKVTQALGADTLRALGTGFVSILVTIAVCLSFILLITIPFIAIYLLAYVVALYLAKIPVAVWLGRFLLGKAKRSSGPYMALFVGLVALYLVFMLPNVISWPAQFVVALLGLGAMTMTYLAHRQARKAAPVGGAAVSQ